MRKILLLATIAALSFVRLAPAQTQTPNLLPTFHDVLSDGDKGDVTLRGGSEFDIAQAPAGAPPQGKPEELTAAPKAKAPTRDEKANPFLADVSLEPYGTVSWSGLDGRAVTGAGANVVAHLTGYLSLWGFGESDNTAHAVIDRAGGGLRLEAPVGPRVRLNAGIGLGYDIEGASSANHGTDLSVFCRVPLGASVNLLKSKYVSGDIFVAYAFDVSGNGKAGAAFGRFFAGPRLTIKL